MRRLLSVALVVLGIAGIGAGILGATLWAPAGHHTARAALSDPGAAVVIDPGLLYVGGHAGTLTVTGPGTVSVIGTAPEDAEAYLGSARYTRVTGVPRWTTLTAQVVHPSGGASVPAPRDADLFAGAQRASGTGSARLEIAAQWARDSGRQSPGPYEALLVTTDGAQKTPTTVEITWPRHDRHAWVPYANAIGAVLAVIGLVLFALDYTSSAARRREAGEETTDEESTRS